MTSSLQTVRSRVIRLEDLFALGSFGPAPVQREYQWQERQVSQLFDDLVGAFGRAGLDPEQPHDADKTVKRNPPQHYFLGALILRPAPEKKDTYSVYDGLQRLTTLALLLACLRDGWPSIDAPSQERLSRLLFLSPELGKGPRLTMPTPGATLANTLNRTRTGGSGDPTAADERMQETRKRLAARLAERNVPNGTEWKAPRRAAFLLFLAERVVFTATFVDNTSLAYQMFVAANSRGLDLSVGDILKGQLVDQANRAGVKADHIKTINRIWRDAQRDLDDEFTDFIAAVEFLQFPQEARHTPGELLLRLFEESQGGRIHGWITGEFVRLVEVFRLSRHHLTTGNPVLAGIDTTFRQLSFVEWKEWQAFYLAIGMAEKNHNAPAFARKIAALRNVAIILTLLDWSERSRHNAFGTAILQLKAGLDPFARNSGDGSFGALSIGSRLFVAEARLAVGGPLSGDARRRAIVHYVESLHWGTRLPKTTPNGTVEHILPVTAFGDWRLEFDHEQREKLTDRLGNLCTLDWFTNRKVGNSQWADKERVFRRLDTPSLGLVLALKAAELVAEPGQPSKWTPLAVRALTEHLAELAEQALGLVPARKA